MAEVILSSLIKVLMENLSSKILQEFGLARNLKKELEKLKSTLLPIQAVIQDAEEKQIRSEPVRDWLRKLKDVAYDAGDILEEFDFEALRQRAESHDVMQNKVRTFFSPRNPFIFRFKMGHKIKAIVERLDVITVAGEKFNFHLKNKATEDKRHDCGERPPTTSFVTESEIYGRADDKEKIIELLLTDEVSSQEDVLIYAIIGMGGLGKTTLAQLVYNDKRLEKPFELKIWVCVSEDFDITRLTKAIIESASGNTCNVLELDPMQRRLQEKLSGRRFLLILDDVWNEDEEKWDGLRHVLRCGAKGSTIIVTTRSEKVASIMATLPTHHLRGLSEDDCWFLFKKRAFGSGRREESPNIVAIGKEIVKKCGGVPLAVKALGSMMRFKSEESEWLFVKESEIWDAKSVILPALRLSYNHLPSHLKQCFSYCSVYPKDHKLVKDILIQLWMANGFIPLEGQRDLDVMGHEIFNELVWGSFFQDIEMDDYGNITCKMHDLMHDLAQSIIENECFIMEPRKAQNIPERVRHLVLYQDSFLSTDCSKAKSLHLDKAKSLHTLLLPENLVPYISKQRCLRVLTTISVNKIPISVDNLKHLRYLNLSYSYFDQLPESMSHLYNLQTLKLRYCWKLRKLPKGMRHMSNLRYLDTTGCNSLTHMPCRMGELSCLRILTRFIVGKEDGRIGDLQGLKLKGKLKIENLGNVRNLAEAKEANLRGKHNLQSLVLYWGTTYSNIVAGSQENVEEVLEGLQPHPNLKKLCIELYPGSKLPHWMKDLLLPNLVEIELVNCERCEDFPPLGKLRWLKVLTVIKMDLVKYLDSDVDRDNTVKAFPSLEKLEISDMPSLEEWARGEGRQIFPLLRELNITCCPKLLTRAQLNFTSLISLEIFDFLELMLPDGLLRNCTLLESLRISYLPHLKSLSTELDNLVSLKELHLEFCFELASLPDGLRDLTSLNSLTISHCNSLMPLPEEGLQGLSSLQSLKIHFCDKLVMSLLEGVQHLTALKYFDIDHCLELTSLPEGLQRVTTLERLSIAGCPHLERRCKKEVGEDWHKIAHIPKISINWEDI